MDVEIKAWLHDILGAINEIDSFFIDASIVFSHYEKDIKTKRAVERNIEIIGEAMNRILKKDRSILISNSRNYLLIHFHQKSTLFQEILPPFCRSGTAPTIPPHLLFQ